MNYLNRKSIYIVGPGLNEKGGISSVVATQFAAGLDREWPICYLATYRSGSSLSTIWMWFSSLIVFFSALALRRVALVHIHTSIKGSFWRKSFFVWLARIFNCPIVLQNHSGDLPGFYARSPVLMQRWIKATYSQADVVVALSASWRNFFAEVLQHPNVMVIHNSVILPVLAPVPIAGRILFLGRFNANKGIFELIKVLSDLVNEFPHLHLYAGGDGDLARAQALIEELDLQKHVSILGWVSGDQKAQQFAVADIFVLPSYKEGLPVGVLEAMASSVAVIASRVGGVPDVIKDSHEGLLFDAGNMQQLRDCLARLLSSPRFSRQLGEAAKQKIEAEFAAPAVLTALSTLYHSLLQRHMAEKQ